MQTTMINDAIRMQMHTVQPTFAQVVIIVPKSFVATIYRQASLAQKKEVHTHGFPKGLTPLSYIEQNFKASLLEHVKEFLFKYFVLSFLFKELYTRKIIFAGEPRLSDVVLVPQEDAEFHFELSLVMPIDLHRWKLLPFKAPKRKNYKDIDRQVESFIKEEHTNLKKNQDNELIGIGDWICFDIALVDRDDNKFLLDEYRENVWLKIGSEEADRPFQDVFINKKKGESFYSTEKCFQDYLTSTINTNYLFYVQIQDVVHNSFFSLDNFKQHFRLKSNKDIHQKLIEVFSYRNDLSLRRAMAEEALRLLITKHQFDVPNHLVLRQQKIVLESVCLNPDYHVYKTQPNFKDQIYQLALKQSQEMLLIDQLMHEENIQLAGGDIKSYLNLVKRARTKEFIYFNPPSTKIDGQETPLSTVLFTQCCLREKTLNHVIYHLTKK